MTASKRKSRRPEQPATLPESMSGYYESSAIAEQLRRRRVGSRRLPVLESGRADPWWYEPPTAGYDDAAAHLLGHGLTPAPNVPALRQMWNSGRESRRRAQIIAQRWDLVA